MTQGHKQQNANKLNFYIPACVLFSNGILTANSLQLWCPVFSQAKLVHFSHPCVETVLFVLQLTFVNVPFLLFAK